MKIFIVFNDCPCDFDDPSILAVYSKKSAARKFIARRKKKDEYTHQYLTILEKRVRIK